MMKETVSVMFKILLTDIKHEYIMYNDYETKSLTSWNCNLSIEGNLCQFK